MLGDLDAWLDERGVLDGQPFLISPDGRYDVMLNRYFEQARMSVAPWNTQAAHARDLKNFLDFLWGNRGGKSWRDATAEDRAAYERWRRKDPAGPRVEHTTWDREVATVNGFFTWAVRQGLMGENRSSSGRAGHEAARPCRRWCRRNPRIPGRAAMWSGSRRACTGNRCPRLHARGTAGRVVPGPVRLMQRRVHRLDDPHRAADQRADRAVAV